MIINLSPVFSEDSISAVVDGDKITINDEEFDFGPLQRGQVLPLGAVESLHFVGPVSRNAKGVIELTLRFPHPINASENMRFPDPITTKGKVKFPVNTTPAEPEPEPLPEAIQLEGGENDQVE